MLRLVASLLLLVSWAQVSAREIGGQPDTLYQVSTLHALQAGDFNGKASFRELRRHGDFGLGTFVALDGEMVAVDGRFYQVRADGVATLVADSELTPFSAVTFFEADDAFRMNGETDCEELYGVLKERFPSDRVAYAIKVTGRFAKIRTRSIPAQDRPYLPYADTLREQVVFKFENVDATLAGFWIPPFLAEVNVAGFHFHAITADATSGGHVLDCRARDVQIEIDATDELGVKLYGDARLDRPMPEPDHGAAAAKGNLRGASN